MKRSTPTAWICRSSKPWSPRTRWTPTPPGMPSTRVSGRAAMRRRARSAATIAIPTGTPTASRLWRAGTPPGWCSCPVAARVGPLRCACVGCGREKTPTPLRPRESAPGSLSGAKRSHRPLPTSAASPPAPTTPCPSSASTLATTPSKPRLGGPAGGPLGPLARRSLFLCRSRPPTAHPTTGRPRRHGARVRLRRP